MLNAYPRPQLRRDSFLSLNGPWDFRVTKADGAESFSGTIEVPCPPESEQSGVNRRIGADETMRYRRAFSLPEANGMRTILHFGAVDQHAEVFLNGVRLGEHAGGYLPFSFDVTEQIKPENELVVIARDPLDHAYPWGKQKQKNGGMWYTPFSGIWQTVWIERVPVRYVTALRLTPTLDAITIGIETNEPFEAARIEIETPSGVLTLETSEPSLTVPIPDPIRWTPETPHLYPLSVTVGDDTVRSYFALRTIGTGLKNGVPRLLLNGEPTFFHGVLDQGYWHDSLCLPPDDGGYERDILALKALGFNTIRKHIRVEPLPFYEACDRLGMLVIQDFVNNGDYRFFHDTLLPTLGMKKLPDRRQNRDPKTRGIFLDTAKETMAHLLNAPCVAGWTIFNEGWGQFDADAVYRALKPLDTTRFFDATSGWFHQSESDVQSEHVYFKRFKPKPAQKPLLLSEFGGYVYSQNAGKRYGYRFFSDPASYRAALQRLYREEILPAVEKGLCGAIYTQTSDVEQEQNGLLSYDRTLIKPDADEMRKIAEELQEEIKNGNRL